MARIGPITRETIPAARGRGEELEVAGVGDAARRSGQGGSGQAGKAGQAGQAAGQVGDRESSRPSFVLVRVPQSSRSGGARRDLRRPQSLPGVPAGPNPHRPGPARPGPARARSRRVALRPPRRARAVAAPPGPAWPLRPCPVPRRVISCCPVFTRHPADFIGIVVSGCDATAGRGGPRGTLEDLL